ncbi:hypothetical protein ACM9HF_11605 [Colwellia sp. RE-S-Sl-9]
MVNKKFPSDYPTHIQVPSEKAAPINIELYRMVGNNPPLRDDFVPSNKDPLQSHMIKQSKFRDSAGYYGTSFSLDKSKLVSVIKGNPNKFGSKKVAKGAITRDMGVGEKDSKTHVTVWFYQNVFPDGFEVL